MDLRDYVRVLRRGWATILAFVIVGIGAGVGLTLATTKVYQADVQLTAFVGPGSDASGAANGNQTYVQSVVQSLTPIANSPLVTSRVALLYKSDMNGLTSDDLASMITADAPLNKSLVNIHVQDTVPGRAARLANDVAKQFALVAVAVVQGNKVATSVATDFRAPGGPAVLSLNATEPPALPSSSKNTLLTLNPYVHPATTPADPIKPNKLLNIGLGLVVGVLIGVGVAVLREILDNTIKGPQDFEDAGVAVLGMVPFDKRTPRSPIAFRSDPHSGRSEAYRQIRTNLQFVDVDNPPRIIAVTSAVPGEGKSTTAINLAASLAEAGARVCLVEADLRRPSIAKALGLVGDVGFTTVVIGKAPVESVLQNAGRNLAVLTSGPIPPNPSELLLSKHAKQVIADLARNVDYLVIDTPPLLPVTDGAELATIADATLLVHRAGKTTRDQAARSIESLDKVGKRPVGVILNMVARGGGKYDQYSYYYSSYRPDRSEGKRGAHHENADHDPKFEDSGTDVFSSPDDGASASTSSSSAQAERSARSGD